MPLAGQKVRASDIVRLQVISKSATESVNNAGSGTTLQNDDELTTAALEVGKSYRIMVHLDVTGAAAADIKGAWSWTGTATKTSRQVMGPQVGTADATVTSMRAAGHGLASAISYGVDGSAASYAFELVRLEEITVAGTLTYQWAQQSGSATNTVMGVRASMEWIEIDLN